MAELLFHKLLERVDESWKIHVEVARDHRGVTDVVQMQSSRLDRAEAGDLDA